MLKRLNLLHVLSQRHKLVSQGERLEALKKAILTFDHNDRDLHDTEIDAGADIALVKNLMFLEFKASFRREPMKCDMEAFTREIGSILLCLECVYR